MNFFQKNKRLVVLLGILFCLICMVAMALIVAFVVSNNPAKKISEAQDVVRREDMQAISSAIKLYIIDNKNQPPKLINGSDLPLVTENNVLTKGADADQMKGIVPKYITSIPKDPKTNKSYKVGLLATGRIILAVDVNSYVSFPVVSK